MQSIVRDHIELVLSFTVRSTWEERARSLSIQIGLHYLQTFLVSANLIGFIWMRIDLCEVFFLLKPMLTEIAYSPFKSLCLIISDLFNTFKLWFTNLYLITFKKRQSLKFLKHNKICTKYKNHSNIETTGLVCNVYNFTNYKNIWC